jgi:hypothetical protein
MDTSEQVVLETSSHTKRRRRTVEEKRRIVEETLEAGASVARVARRHGLWVFPVRVSSISLKTQGLFFCCRFDFTH